MAVNYDNDYNKLSNKPTINGVELQGNKTFENLGEKQISESELTAMIDKWFRTVFGGN